MKQSTIAFLSAMLLALPAQASDGDPAKGERVFNQCQACHVVEAPDGEVLAGRAGKLGPNLYGIAERPAASLEGFKYGDDIVKAGEMGLVWDKENFVEYLKNPTDFLREYTEDKSARSAMSFRLRKEEDAENVYAYIKSLTR
jgi:cytochrome c